MEDALGRWRKGLQVRGYKHLLDTKKSKEVNFPEPPGSSNL